MGKFWSFFLIVCSLSASAMALDSSVSFENDDLDNSVIKKYEEKIADLKQKLKDSSNLVGKIKECHQNKLLYTSSGCASPFQPELDPNTQSQAIIANPISVCPAGQVHHWSGGSWSCKEVRKDVNSGVPPGTKKWKWTTTESCADTYIRKCNDSDDTCPGLTDPDGKTCTPQPACRFVMQNKKFFKIYSCG